MKNFDLNKFILNYTKNKKSLENSYHDIEDPHDTWECDDCYLEQFDKRSPSKYDLDTMCGAYLVYRLEGLGKHKEVTQIVKMLQKNNADVICSHCISSQMLEILKYPGLEVE